MQICAYNIILIELFYLYLSFFLFINITLFITITFIVTNIITINYFVETLLNTYETLKNKNKKWFVFFKENFQNKFILNLNYSLSICLKLFVTTGLGLFY